ncbi:hypothetical protein EFK50_04980 [Nocardioides marmoriginsengisoli]|uniref:Uncharacterized protein n=1 Tax=Nocardioides marmoriginsengisoli TaxID=661483 RepID=A0A3N0CPD9_9ACTN|nr:hypothetical protein [Nocardioides marmoriginsengisoli]RNL65315.1 hypothetical protein EFK50_04980 [Nocardioides marmoriginsengisoli]
MRIVVVPSTLALLPRYASASDPIPELRAAVHAATAWVLEDGPVGGVAGSPAGLEVARHLVGDPVEAVPGLLVAAGGSAMRTENAPGAFDERAEGYDAVVGKALATGDLEALSRIDVPLAEELWAGEDALVLAALGRRLAGTTRVLDVQVDYDDAPYGVQYWVVRWQCES